MYNAKLQGKDRISKAWQLQSPVLKKQFFSGAVWKFVANSLGRFASDR
jgi:hypothetical protein